MTNGRSMPRILLHWDALGVLHWVSESGIEVVCIDERCPYDRIYRSTGDAENAKIINRVLLGEDPVDAAAREC